MAARSGFFAELDEVLLARARRGDLDALEVVYRTYSGAVYSLARRLCRSPEDADEVLQDTFLEVVRKIGSFRGQGAFGGWLRRVAVSKALMLQRRAKVRRAETMGDTAVAADEFAPREAGRPVEARLDVERALARLPDATRMVVWLHDVEGMTHAEIGQLFGRTESFSKSQLSRGYDRLRLWMGNQEKRNHASDHRRAVGAAGR
jgi:RNA polymerase sigma-70 factor (ECF subfamily)